MPDDTPARRSWLPPEVQGWLRLVLLIVALKFLGVDASTVNELVRLAGGTAEAAKNSAEVAKSSADAAALTVSNLDAVVTRVVSNFEVVVTSVLQRQDDERRKRMTLSNDVARLYAVGMATAASVSNLEAVVRATAENVEATRWVVDRRFLLEIGNDH